MLQPCWEQGEPGSLPGPFKLSGLSSPVEGGKCAGDRRMRQRLGPKVCHPHHIRIATETSLASRRDHHVPEAGVPCAFSLHTDNSWIPGGLLWDPLSLSCCFHFFSFSSHLFYPLPEVPTPPFSPPNSSRTHSHLPRIK